MSKSYLLLAQEIKEINQIYNVINLLSWDIAVNIPAKAISSRSDELAILSSTAHTRLKANKVQDLLLAAEAETNNLDHWQQANLREIRRQVQQASCLSNDLQRRYDLAAIESEMVWRAARKNNDFQQLKPYLQEVLDCVREIAAVRAAGLGCGTYEALVDKYDPARQLSELKQVASVLKDRLPALIRQVVERQKTIKPIPLGQMNIEQQKRLGRRVMTTMMFNFDYGRLDESTHPFCGGTPFDTRITNRYREDDLISGLMGIIHETGHGLYAQNLPIAYRHQPVGYPRSMAIHESQSLIMEMQVGRSEAFCQFLSKLLRDEFNCQGAAYSGENLYRLATKVEPSLIRVYADEVTYPLHVILRFEMEELLINDQLKLADSSEFWNNKMQEYLGVTPVTSSQGILQDIHWPSGAFGYFPVYNNGAILASMLMAVVRKTLPKVEDRIAQGDFSELNTILNQQIREHGSLYESSELIKHATGEDQLNPQTFLAYLTKKYLS